MNIQEEIVSKTLSCEKLIFIFLVSSFLASNSMLTWQAAHSHSESFDIEMIILIPEETISFKTGFWYLIKFAWLQYLSVFLIFYYLIYHIKLFVFKNRLVDCIVQDPNKIKNY